MCLFSDALLLLLVGLAGWLKVNQNINDFHNGNKTQQKHNFLHCTLSLLSMPFQQFFGEDFFCCNALKFYWSAYYFLFACFVRVLFSLPVSIPSYLPLATTLQSNPWIDEFLIFEKRRVNSSARSLALWVRCIHTRSNSHGFVGKRVLVYFFVISLPTFARKKALRDFLPRFFFVSVIRTQRIYTTFHNMSKTRELLHGNNHCNNNNNIWNIFVS